MKARFFTIIIIFLLIRICNAANSLQAVSIHDVIGVSIDSLENANWHIIGDVKGFREARIYKKNVYEYYLHIYRSPGEQPRFLFIKLDREKYRTLEAQLKRRLDKNNNKGPWLFNVNKRYLQHDDQFQLTLVDDSELYVRLVSIHQDTLVFKTSGGLNVSVPAGHITSVYPFAKRPEHSRYWQTDPGLSRLYYMPTGFGLKGGGFTVSDYWFVLAHLGYGITNNISVYGGRTILLGKNLVNHAMPKITCSVHDLVHVGAGYAYYNFPQDDDEIRFPFGVVTIGGPSDNLTLGGGVSKDENNKKTNVLMLGGSYQIGRKVKVIAEHWRFTKSKDVNLTAFGIRLFNKDVNIDLGVLTTKNNNLEWKFSSMVWLGFSLFLGNK